MNKDERKLKIIEPKPLSESRQPSCTQLEEVCLCLLYPEEFDIKSDKANKYLKCNVKEGRIVINKYFVDLVSLTISMVFRGLTYNFLYVTWLKYKINTHKYNSVHTLY